MAHTLSITDVNCIFTLSVSIPVGSASSSWASLLPNAGVPFKLSGLASRQIATSQTPVIVLTETDIEGNLWGGYQANAKNITVDFTFVPTSESITILETIRQVQNGMREVVYFAGNAQLPSVNKSFSWDSGYMTRFPSFGNMGNVLENQTVTFEFENYRQIS